MKKLLALILVVLTTGIFAGDWYSKAEKININSESASKDTLWYGYPVGTSGWVMRQFAERATYYNVDDFGLEYPIILHAVNAGFTEDGYDYSFKIYAKDGTTVLWDSGTQVSFDGNNSIGLVTPLIITDDFWFSVTPNTSGFPSQFGPDTGQAPSQSYLSDGSGGWINQIENINGEDVYIENYYDVFLEPYTGMDVFPPNARTLSGNNAFQDVNMNLVLTVQDQNIVTSPMASQYSLDGGGSWIDFDMTVSKTNYTFTGTIPAQADGTVGLVKFNMFDDQGYSAWSDNFDITWSKDTPMLAEDFENATFPPDGWSLNTAGAGWVEGAVVTGGFVHGGAKAAAHMDDSGTQDDWLITPLISIPALPSATLTFWETVYWTQYMNGMNEIGVTSDGGTTWDIIWSEDPTFVAENIIDGDFYARSATLAAYAGQDIQLGFHYTGDYGCQWYIDDIEVLYDYEAPAITSIVGNEALAPTIGAYLNNDMDINLEIYDMTGVDTVVGHYSFDGGTTIVDIDFAKAKGVTENWTASIPAMSTVESGTINFDLKDLGGLSTTTTDYNIEFVTDPLPPVFGHVTGRDVFIGDDMKLEIVFSDESAITSCNGSYSKDGWVTQYDFALTPSKIHEYTYTGTIPAETVEVLDGEVAFTIGDAEGNFLTSDYYKVRWLDGQIEFFEDFESGFGNWGANGDWAIVEEEEYTSATHALTESPGGIYGNDVSSFVMYSNIMDWSGYFGGSISFWCKYDLEGGFDYMYFEGSPDNGMTWVRLKTWNGIDVGWHEEFISMDGFAGESQVTFRFLFQSDQGLGYNGMYIDDIELKTYNSDIAPPSFETEPYATEFYEGTLGDYNGTMRAFDVSGVTQVNALYTVDGGDTLTVAATATGTNDEWDYTIPTQPSGSVVKYWFWAEDGSAENNSGYSDSYTYIAGDHLIYDNGLVSYINNIIVGDALAVRMTVPGSDATTTYGAELSYLLLKNYADLDTKSDSMTVRVWQDDGTGQPGVEVLTPILHLPEANTLVDPEAMSMIDLRSEGLTVYGDFWIGFSAEIGDVYYCYTVPSETGTTNFQRSFTGLGNGDGTWTWSQANDTNFHFRAIVGFGTFIEENNNIPMTTSLEQNYPNPFNPTTTINFTIANEAKTSLVVYDVMGRVVAKLVDGNLTQGSHKVSFDASNLVSGVYYYNLKSGNVNQTKKMMLIK